MPLNLPLPPHIIWMVISCHIISIACTLARLVYRWYTKRFWWEDVWAMIAALWAVICFSGLLLYDTSMSPISARNQVADWFGTISNTMVVWAVRFSLFLSLVRVSNPTGSSRYVALTCIASFLIMCIASTAQKIYYCVARHCNISSPVAIMQLTTDVLGDAILVLAPVPFLRDLQLSKNRRILILATFSSSILVSALSITQSAFLLHAFGPVSVTLAEFKVSLSLFICNILVLVTCIYRVWRRGKGGGTDLDASFPCRQTYYLTSIDLGQLTAGTLSSGDEHTGTTRSMYTHTDARTQTASTGTTTSRQEQDVGDAAESGRVRAQHGARAASPVVCAPPAS